MLETDAHRALPTQKHRAFDQIPPRPPTPPKDSSKTAPKKKAVKTRDDTVVDDDSNPSSREISPPSSSAESASGRPKKRVSWSPWTIYHKPESIPTTPVPRPRLPPSSDRKSLKSALKPYSSPIPIFSPSPSAAGSGPIVAHTHASFPSMLESVVQALASTERSKKLDAYITFSNTLRAYDEIPDIHSLEDKIPALCAYLRRDLVAKIEDGGNADSQLIQQAIKLMTILSWTPSLIEAMDDQSAVFFFQHAIQKIEDPQTSKLSVNLYLHFLAQQKFPPRIVTTDRCNRLITALQDMDDRVTGKSISKERIDVYNKLLVQSRQTMLARAPDWMDHMFSGLLSSVKETRNRALICMAEVGKTMGAERSIQRTVSNIFGRPNGEGKTMFESIRQRLEMFVEDGEGIFVARMWAVVLLLVRANGDKWEFFIPWLRIIEKCFNVSDKDVKVEAQAAWSKLIYAMNIGAASNRKLLELLCKPLEQYLDPKNIVSNTRKPRKAAMLNVCVMLYYGFRPTSSWKQLSEIWDVVIVGLVENLALASREEVVDGCNILSALFDGSTQKIWTDHRVLVGPPIKPDELPRLDPKWVRSNCAKVIRTIEIVLSRCSWKDEDTSQGVRTLWRRFMRTLGDAGIKEIKVSAELMEAVAHLFNLFQRVWTSGPPSLAGFPADDDSFTRKFTFLVEIAFDSLGALCFTEKQLVYDEQTKFSVAPTPTHKYPSGDGIRYPPILHMFRFLLQPPQGVSVDEDYLICARTILSKCCGSQDSRRKKLQLLSSCETMLARRDVGAVDRELWAILADLVCSSLPASTRERVVLSPSPSGSELKDAVQVLKWGSQYEVSGWDKLFADLVTVTRDELGESHLAMDVIDPIAESLRYRKSDSSFLVILRRVKRLVDSANYPRKKADVATKLNFGLNDRRSIDGRYFESLYAIVNQSLKDSYTPFPDKTVKALGMDLFSSAVDFVARAPMEQMGPMQSMQDGLGVWATDTKHLIIQMDGLNPTTATTKWAKVMRAVQNLPKHDSLVLSGLGNLIASGLESRRKGTVDATVRVWNATFGKQGSLVYPKRIRIALRRLRPIADISLPAFPEDADDEDGMQTPPTFSESQEVDNAFDVHDIWTSPSPVRPAALSDLRSRTSSPAVVKETPFPTRRGRRSLQRTTPTRPRHLDSQIEFALIDNPKHDHTLDSQVLTENQKEVKEKQAEAVQLFSEFLPAKINSSATHKENWTPSGSSTKASPVVVDLRKREGTTNDHDSNPESPHKPQQLTNGHTSPISLISESQLVSRSTYELGACPTAVTENHTDARASSKESDGLMQASSSPTEPDVPASEQPAKDTLVAKIPVLNDPQSDADDFVDALENHTPSDTDEPTAIAAKSAIEVGNEVPPITADDPSTQEDTEGTEVSDVSSERRSSPEAQIMAEVRSANGTPLSQRSRHGKKRKRVASIAKGPTPSPDVFDTIVLSHSDTASQSNGADVPVEDDRRPTKKSKVPKLTLNLSPPKTRSLKKYAPPRKAILEQDSSSHKLAPVTPNGQRYNDSFSLHQPRAENSLSPTPKPRGLASISRKRLQPIEENTPAKQQSTSFIQETQLDIPSSIPDSYIPVATVVNPTIGTRTEPLLDDNSTDSDDEPRSSPPRDMEASNPQNTPTGNSGHPSYRGSGMKACKPTRAKVQVERTPHREVVTSTEAMDAIDHALNLIQLADMSADEIGIAEDKVFELFASLRARKRQTLVASSPLQP